SRLVVPALTPAVCVTVKVVPDPVKLNVDGVRRSSSVSRTGRFHFFSCMSNTSGNRSHGHTSASTLEPSSWLLAPPTPRCTSPRRREADLPQSWLPCVGENDPARLVAGGIDEPG